MFEERLVILREIFDDVQFIDSRSEARIFCPHHSHHSKKLWISLDKNVFQCWVCGYSGRIFKLLRDYGSRQQAAAFLKTLGIETESPVDLPKTVELPPEYVFLFDGKKSPTGIAALSQARNEFSLSCDTILQGRIGFCASGVYANRIIFPSFGVDGNINYFLGRAIWPSNKKYLDCSDVPKSSIIFNELLINWTKPVILVEGVKAHLKHLDIGNVVPILGSNISERSRLLQQIILNDCPCVYIALDKDARQKSFEFMAKLSKHGVEVKFIDIDDQPDIISSEVFMKKILQASSFSKESYILNMLASL